MNFGYVQGQEAQALAYYRKLLETEHDPGVRKQLEELVERLQKIVGKKVPQNSTGTAAIQNICLA